jgi:phosphoglycerate dehydrogenase-like enzyme
MSATESSARPRVAVLIPEPMRANILSREVESELASFADVVSGAVPDRLASALEGAVACITGWGTPPLTEAMWERASDLRLVAHTAGSIHKLVPVDALHRGLKVSHAAAIIADSVGEIVLGQTLRFLRHLDAIDREMKSSTGWHDIRDHYPGRLLASRVVGVIGTGYVGRRVAQLFGAFGCRVLAADPHLSEAQAAELGVEKVELDDLYRQSDIVSLHAPALPETAGLLSGKRLAMLGDGALVINMSRGSLVDEDALLQELENRRLFAVLDVYIEEPLPADSPFRSVPNTLLSPHVAGHTVDSHFRQGRAMVDEVRRLVQGQPLRYAITVDRLATMA